MDIYAKFHNYSSKADADPRKDRLSMRTRIMSLADDDFDTLMLDIVAVLNKYEQKEKGADKKLRSLSLISAPVWEVKV